MSLAISLLLLYAKQLIVRSNLLSCTRWKSINLLVSHSSVVSKCNPEPHRRSLGPPRNCSIASILLYFKYRNQSVKVSVLTLFGVKGIESFYVSDCISAIVTYQISNIDVSKNTAFQFKTLLSTKRILYAKLCIP